MTCDYQVNLLRKSADRIQKVLPETVGSSKLRLQELQLDLRREAHELEDSLTATKGTSMMTDKKNALLKTLNELDATLDVYPVASPAHENISKAIKKLEQELEAFDAI